MNIDGAYYADQAPPNQSWHRVYVLFPRKTVSGEKVRGTVYKRYRRDIHDTCWYAEYGTKKDVFADKLKTGEK